MDNKKQRSHPLPQTAPKRESLRDSFLASSDAQERRYRVELVLTLKSVANASRHAIGNIGNACA